MIVVNKAARRLVLNAVLLNMARSAASSNITPMTTSDFATGDLIFVEPSYNKESLFDDAILATGEATVLWLRRNGVPDATSEVASHVAMAYRDSSGSLFFVQALPPAVVLTPELDFWHSSLPGTTFYHAKATDPAVAAAGPAAVNAALAQIGAPYAYDFETPDTGSFYCSSLVEWSFEQALSSENVLCPANYTLLFVPERYWEWYYENLGLKLPVNASGSNPTLLLHSPKLTFALFNSTVVEMP